MHLRGSKPSSYGLPIRLEYSHYSKCFSNESNEENENINNDIEKGKEIL